MADIDLSQIESYIAKQAVITAVYQDTVIVMKCKSGYAEIAVLRAYYKLHKTVPV